MGNLIIVGLCEKAKNYLDSNNKFIKGTSIGCKRSDGVINTTAISYKFEKVDDDDVVLLFKYYLKGGEAYTKIQLVKNKHVFISLLTDKGKEIKWTKKEIDNYLNHITQGR